MSLYEDWVTESASDFPAPKYDIGDLVRYTNNYVTHVSRVTAIRKHMPRWVSPSLYDNEPFDYMLDHIPDCIFVESELSRVTSDAKPHTIKYYEGKDLSLYTGESDE